MNRDIDRWPEPQRFLGVEIVIAPMMLQVCVCVCVCARDMSMIS